jgi:hypothetical protein
VTQVFFHLLASSGKIAGSGFAEAVSGDGKKGVGHQGSLALTLDTYYAIH